MLVLECNSLASGLGHWIYMRGEALLRPARPYYHTYRCRASVCHTPHYVDGTVSPQLLMQLSNVRRGRDLHGLYLTQ